MRNIDGGKATSGDGRRSADQEVLASCLRCSWRCVGEVRDRVAQFLDGRVPCAAGG